VFRCLVCGSIAATQGFVNEVFTIGERRVMVEHIPGEICDRCGEAAFSRETTERVRKLVHGEGRPVRTISMDVFALR
jgi:YgiT-type zinc finger domain-containing protein